MIGARPKMYILCVCHGGEIAGRVPIDGVESGRMMSEATIPEEGTAKHEEGFLVNDLSDTDDLLGLSAAFYFAGAGAVVSTLWKIDIDGQERRHIAGRLLFSTGTGGVRVE
jgi:hypothetical protein